MNSTARYWFARSLVVITAAAPLAGCGEDSAVGPDPVVALAADVGAERLAVDLGDCDELGVPAGSVLAFHAYARGLQIYRWDGGTWTLDGPSATLFADAGGKGAIGTHYAGPTWESRSGSKVKGAVSQRCTPNPDAVPWLLLDAVSSEGPGVFDGVTHIQRVNTMGGKAPIEAGAFTGQVKGSLYTAEYLFYRAP